MPSDRCDVTLCKINASGNTDYYVHIKWIEHGKKGFYIQATDGLQCWRGELGASDMQELAKKASLSLADFAELTLRAFSQTGNCDGMPLCCYIAKTAEGLQVAWKRVLASEQIKFQLGMVVLEECANQGQVHLEFLGHAMTLTHELQSTCTTLSLDNRRLAEERDSAVKKLELLVEAKQEHEKILFQNFVAVLNAKKAKLRQLAATPTAAPQNTKDKGTVISTADSKVTSKAATPPSLGDSSDDTEVDDDMDTHEEHSAAKVNAKTQALNESLLSNDDDAAAAQPVLAYRRRAYRADASKPSEPGVKMARPSATVPGAAAIAQDDALSGTLLSAASSVGTAADLIEDL